MSTLVELGQKFVRNDLIPEELVNESKKIQVFMPYQDGNGDGPEHTVWSIGNDNAWEDVRTKLVDTGKMSLSTYGDFFKWVVEGQKARG